MQAQCNFLFCVFIYEIEGTVCVVIEKYEVGWLGKEKKVEDRLHIYEKGFEFFLKLNF